MKRPSLRNWSFIVFPLLVSASHKRPALLPQGKRIRLGPISDVLTTDPFSYAIATGIASCIQLLGSVIGIAIAQVILTNGLSKFIAPLGLDATTIRAIKTSVEVIKTLPGDIRPEVIDAYVKVSEP